MCWRVSCQSARMQYLTALVVVHRTGFATVRTGGQAGLLWAYQIPDVQAGGQEGRWLRRQSAARGLSSVYRALLLFSSHARARRWRPSHTLGMNLPIKYKDSVKCRNSHFGACSSNAQFDLTSNEIFLSHDSMERRPTPCLWLCRKPRAGCRGPGTSDVGLAVY